MLLVVIVTALEPVPRVKMTVVGETCYILSIFADTNNHCVRDDETMSFLSENYLRTN